MTFTTILDELCVLLAAQITSPVALLEPPASGYNLFKGRMQDAPDLAVAMVETTGLPPEYSLGSAIEVEHPRIQLLVRGEAQDYQGPRRLIEQIKQALDRPVNQAVGGVYYLNIDIHQPPFELDRDEKERVILAMNFSAAKAPSPIS